MLIFQKYFQGAKAKGSKEPAFLEKINGAFICLVAAAIRHCLKAWKTGDYDPKSPDFKYQTAWCRLIQYLLREDETEV